MWAPPNRSNQMRWCILYEIVRCIDCRLCISICPTCNETSPFVGSPVLVQMVLTALDPHNDGGEQSHTHAVRSGGRPGAEGCRPVGTHSLFSKNATWCVTRTVA